MDSGIKYSNYFTPKTHILLVDDDPIFCRTAEMIAKDLGVSLLSCQSIWEMRNLALSGVFDVAIVDYHLEGAKENLKGPAIAQHLRNTPTVLISSSEKSSLEPDIWPSTIKAFMSKKKGAMGIIKAALQLKLIPRKIDHSFKMSKKEPSDLENIHHKMILVDDDQIYGHLLKSTACSLGIELQVFTSPQALNKQNWEGIVALLIDYELQTITGISLISIMRRGLLGAVPPTFLISENRSIREVKASNFCCPFISKTVGAKNLLSRVMSTINAKDIQNSVSFSD